jgi:ribosomal protein S18 acetylase RimI-like enzyme
VDISYKRDLIDVDWNEMKATLLQDNFDNGRTAEQLRESFSNSYSTCIAYAGDRIIGTARALSDGVCNAYVIDVWTLSKFRRQGIGRRMMEILVEPLQGQHVYLFSDDMVEFYKKIGYEERPTGLQLLVGEWLKK